MPGPRASAREGGPCLNGGMRLRRLAAVLALALTLAACGSADDAGTAAPSSSAEAAETTAETAAPSGRPASEWLTDEVRAEIEQDASALVETLAGGDAGAMHERGTENTRQSITEDQLLEAWTSTEAMVGAWARVVGVDVVEAENWAVATVLTEHANGHLAASLTYTESRELDGIWFAPAMPEQVAALGGEAAPSDSPGEEVSIGEYALPGRLIVPDGAQAVVLFVSGSGPQDMDGTVGGSTLFRDVAAGLEDAGIASLRVSDRYSARPELAAEGITIQDEILDDAAAAIAFLESDPRTAGLQIVVLGHSLGAMVLPNLLADNPVVAGGILAAGSPRSLWDIMLDQNIAVFESAEAEELVGQPSLEEITAEIDRANGLTDPDAPPLLGTVPAAYVVSLNELESAEVAAGLTVPMLVMQGEQDVQVSVEADFEAWKPVLAGVPDVTYELFPGVNHLFMPSDGGGVEEYLEPATVAPEVLAAVVQWIEARFAG